MLTFFQVINNEIAGNKDFQNLGGHKTIEAPVTPQKNNDQDDSQPEQADPSSNENSGSGNSSKSKSKYKGKGVDSKGRPRNFYNPPGKVLRHLAQQSYYDNFYGNQGQFYTLKQKFKTQMCKHFLENGKCPLQQFCQFAHGPQELRQPNDVSQIFKSYILSATSKELWKDCTRSCPL